MGRLTYDLWGQGPYPGKLHSPQIKTTQSPITGPVCWEVLPKTSSQSYLGFLVSSSQECDQGKPGPHELTAAQDTRWCQSRAHTLGSPPATAYSREITGELDLPKPHSRP